MSDREAGWVSATVAPGGFRTAIDARTHALVADEPTGAGGTDEGPTPYELLLGALAACTAMTVRMYADRKGWLLGDVTVRLRTAHAHAADCVSCETDPVGVGRLERELAFHGDLTDEQRARLLEIANKCPVHKTLTGEIRIESQLAR